jgi:Flp pilus assembly protein TadD
MHILHNTATILRRYPVTGDLRAVRIVGLKTRALVLAGALFASVALSAQLPPAPLPSAAASDAALSAAQRLMDAGQFDRAAAMLSDFVVAQPKSAVAHQMLGYLYLRLDDPRRSLEEYTRAAAIASPSAVDLQNVAKDYVLLGDTASAGHWLTVSLQRNDRDPETWYSLGRIRYTEQHFQEAADCFQRSLALLPRSVKAENNLGLSYEGLNRTDDAVAAYRQAIAWQQDQPHRSEQPLLNLGIILVHQGKLEEARKLLTEAVALAPHDPRIHEQLGHLYLQIPMLAEAQLQFEEAIRLEPKNPALHFLLGKVYHQQGQEQKAKAEFAASATLSGDHSTPDKF